MLSISCKLFRQSALPAIPNQKSIVGGEVCCKGYVGSPGNCQPVCKPDCVDAVCTAPQQCTCLAGYETVDRKEYSKLGCHPICQNCRFGDCTEPDQCTCWPAFQKDPITDRCQPIADMLLPPNRWPTHCNCLRRYVRKQEESVQCLQICNKVNGSRFTECLNTTHCLYNSLNDDVICVGLLLEDLPVRYACQHREENPSGRIDPTISLTHHTNRPNSSVQTPRPYQTELKALEFEMSELKDANDNERKRSHYSLVPTLCLFLSCFGVCAIALLVIVEFMRSEDYM